MEQREHSVCDMDGTYVVHTTYRMLSIHNAVDTTVSMCYIVRGILWNSENILCVTWTARMLSIQHTVCCPYNIPYVVHTTYRMLSIQHTVCCPYTTQ